MLGRQEELLLVVTDTNDKRVPEVARVCLSALGVQLRRFKEQILEFDRLITAWHRSNEMSRRLDDIPGVGPVLDERLTWISERRTTVNRDFRLMSRGL